MKFRLILLFLLWYTCANAQVALVYDSIGDIQMLPIKDEDDSTPYLRQFSFTCIDRQNNRQITLTPDSCHGYRFSSHMLYASKTFEYAGETKRLFLRRVRVYQDSIVFYVYYNDKAALEPIYYFQTRDDDRVYPMADDPEKGYISPLHSLLLSYPMAEDPEVRAYFDKMEPTPRSFVKRHRLALSKYASHLPRFKWGVTLGLASSKLKADDYKMDQVMSVVPGVFADIPILPNTSYHPELTFEKYAAKGRRNLIPGDFNHAAYNVTSLATPQLIRYTMFNLPKRLLPYVELGGQFTLNMKHSLEYSYIKEAGEDINTNLPIVHEIRGEEDIPAASLALLGGVGAEWQCSRHHSWFVSVRLVKEMGDFGRTGCLLQISYSL